MEKMLSPAYGKVEPFIAIDKKTKLFSENVARYGVEQAFQACVKGRQTPALAAEVSFSIHAEDA
jgi:hypothetical protein